ncbi:RimK family alpha-L-glutamate ligase, partial [Streptomonospora algeriensis]
MIYVIGLDSDSTFMHFLRTATEQGAEIRAVNLHAVIDSGGWRLRVPDDGDSWLKTSGETISMDPMGCYYTRIIDLSRVQTDARMSARWAGLITALQAWLENIPGRVVNRPGKVSLHNSTKPLHEEFLRRSGFNVPSSLTSSKRGDLVEFSRAGKTIVKTVSGIRANARIVGEAEVAEADLSFSPVHLQRFVSGADIRAHVVGEDVHSEMIESEDTDYRSGDGRREFAAHTCPADLNRKMVRATRDMGLDMAGWDFKLSPDGTYWCLEANPMPGYDGYDRRLGGRITSSLLHLLRAEGVPESAAAQPPPFGEGDSADGRTRQSCELPGNPDGAQHVSDALPAPGTRADGHQRQRQAAAQSVDRAHDD